MSDVLKLFFVAIALFLAGCWADGWDFSVFKIIRKGQPEFSWYSVAAILAYGAATTLLGVSLGFFRIEALTALGVDPKVGSHIGLFHTENYGCIHALSYLLFFLSLPAAIVLCIWQYIAN